MRLQRFSSVAVLVLLQALLVSGAAFAPVPAAAQATAALYLSPGSGSHSIGSSFTVTVRVNTGGQAINASDGFLTYDPSIISVVGVSRAGSIFNLWTSEPAFSNGAGSISYSGGTTSPYNGSGGAIMTATFRALREGVATVRFSSGSVLAADGKGTNIIGSLGSGSYSFGAVQTTPTPPPPPRPNTPAAPTVTSDSHPSPDAWYANPNVSVKWTLPSGTTAVRTSLNQNPNAVPTQVQSSSATSQVFEGVEDGISYVHVQVSNENGWGSVAHFRVQIDTEDPSAFEITEVERDDLTNPRVAFELSGEDATSGIAYYDVQIDGGEQIRYEDEEGTGVYQTAPQAPGTHTIIITAYDAAGNSIVDSEQFHVNAIGAPKITEYTEKLRESDIFVVRGETFQNAKVTITLTPRGQGEVITGETETGTDGRFTFVLDEKLTEGAWDMTATVTDSRGAMSRPSDALPVLVGPNVFQEVSERVIDFVSLMIGLLGALFLAGFLIWYGWHRVRIFLGMVERETKETEGDIKKEFDLLRTSLKEHIAALEHASTKRDLSREEERMRDEMQRQLNEAEKRLLGEVHDIEKQIIEEEHPIRRFLRRLRRK